MKKAIIGSILTIVFQGLVIAQSSDKRITGNMFIGLGINSNSDGTMHMGGGIEGLIYEGLGIGGEAAYLTPISDMSGGIGAVSGNLSYHFRRDHKVSPFVTGGISFGFRDLDSIQAGGNVGAGLDYWLENKRVAIRFEVRDYIFSSDSPHFFGGRVGLTFR
jgi:hypothetical protein